MSGILRRTVYYDERPAGPFNFLGFARVTTGIGTMIEPFQPGIRHAVGTAIGEYDPEDMMVRIDVLQRIDGRQQKAILSGGSSIPLHGGVTITHTGR